MGIQYLPIIPEKPIVDVKALRADLVKAVAEESKNAVEFMREYPPQLHYTREQVYGQPFVSDRQRRYFFAALRDGRIQVPYRRGNTLARSWNAEVRETARTIEGKVYSNGNIAPYNIWVQDTEQQSKFMAYKGWKVVGFMVKRVFEPRLKAALHRVFAELTS